MEYQQPPWHYEQVYIRHLDGHEGDETDSEEMPESFNGISLIEYEMMVKDLKLR